VLESMACGTPVIASNASSLTEVCGKAAILVSPDSDDEHVEAISEVLNNSATRRRLTVAGEQRARSFTWESSASKLRGYLADLV
jgi:glycosyltransferase involved in cell wall biosynthesis